VNTFEALIFARCLGFVFRAPGFSHPAVPPPLRAGIAYALSLSCAHGRRSGPTLSWLTFAPALLVEIALGAAIGIAASALYDGAYSGGRAVDDYVGIRVSVPTAGVVAGAGFGRLWSLAFTATFFVLGGDRAVLAALAGTFVWLPPGAVLGAGFAAFVLGVPQTLLRASLLVAAPALALAFMAQLALAVIGRIVPRFSTFPLTFPIVLGCALIATFATLPAVLPVAGHPWLDLARLAAP
jgi:type III secretory pathway component EscT